MIEICGYSSSQQFGIAFKDFLVKADVGYSLGGSLSLYESLDMGSVKVDRTKGLSGVGGNDKDFEGA